MNRLLAGICLTALLLPLDEAPAGEVYSPQQIIGTLNCEIVPHSGINLLIHSTRVIDCIFKPSDDSSEEHYKGETGIGFGFDVAIRKGSKLSYSVLADHFIPGTQQLAGKYSGTSGSATLGVSVGDTAPIQKNDGSITLQPRTARNSGAGLTAGFSYLYLQATDKTSRP